MSAKGRKRLEALPREQRDAMAIEVSAFFEAHPELAIAPETEGSQIS
jgi:hypothetical protein